MQPGVGLRDPHGSFPTQDILRLYGLFRKYGDSQPWGGGVAVGFFFRVN